MSVDLFGFECPREDAAAVVVSTIIHALVRVLSKKRCCCGLLYITRFLLGFHTPYKTTAVVPATT